VETTPQGWIKLNYDAGFCYQSGRASIGAIVRNAEGRVLLTPLANSEEVQLAGGRGGGGMPSRAACGGRE
jgi:hypothetical protein